MFSLLQVVLGIVQVTCSVICSLEQFYHLEYSEKSSVKLQTAQGNLLSTDHLLWIKFSLKHLCGFQCMCFVAAQSFSRALERSSVSVLGNGVLSKPASLSASWAPILIGYKCPWHTWGPWGPGVSGLLIIVSSSPWNQGLRAPQQTSAGCKGCDQLSPACLPRRVLAYIPPPLSFPLPAVTLILKSQEDKTTTPPFPMPESSEVLWNANGIQQAWASHSG